MSEPLMHANSYHPAAALPADLQEFLRTRVPQLDNTEAWAVGGAWLTGQASGAALLPPGQAARVARALGEWITRHGQLLPEFAVDGAALLSERAAYTGLGRNGSVTVGGSGALLPLSDGSLAAVSCARADDPALYGAALACHVPEGDPWPALANALTRTTPEELRRVALELSLPCWPVDTALHLGPHNTAISDGPFLPATPSLASRTARRRRDFSRTRVVDFSSLWAGPLCAQLLGGAGAEVIKVESIDRPDGARRGHPDFYRLLHAGHRAVSFAPRDTASLERLHDLVASADIVIEASRPRALARLGIDAATHVAAGATWVSITAAGRASNRIGFGDDVAASAGLVAQAPDHTACFVGDALADPLTGLFAAAACMTVPDTPSGELWDLSMSELVRTTLVAPPEPRGSARALPPCRRSARAGTAPLLGADNAALLGGSRG